MLVRGTEGAVEIESGADQSERPRRETLRLETALVLKFGWPVVPDDEFDDLVYPSSAMGTVDSGSRAAMEQDSGE